MLRQQLQNMTTRTVDAPIVVPMYDHLIRPTSGTAADSPWQHFGFPASPANRVLTRSCVVCMVCRCALPYNAGDDRIMRAHLRDEHSPLYDDLLAATSKLAPTSTGTKRIISRRHHIEPGEYVATLTSVRHHQTSVHGIHPEAVAVAPRNAGDDRNEGYDDVKRDDDKSATNDEECYDGNANDEAIEFLLSEQSPEQELDVVDAVDDLDDLKPTFKRPRVDREETSPLTNVEMQRLLAKMCASDLRDPEICDGVGFTEFVVALSGSSGAPCATAVRAELRNMRDAMRRSCGDASRRGPFALGLEKWRTAAGCWYYTLSLLTGGAVDGVERRSLCTWLETKKAHGPWQQAIAGLDMNQCQAVVVNFNADASLPCMSGWLVACGRQHQSLPIVRCLRNVIQTIAKHIWTYYQDSHVFANDVDVGWLDELFDEARERNVCPDNPHLLACLRTLQTALETVRLESTATAALNLALCWQLVDNHFGESDDDSEDMREMKRLLRSYFKEFVYADKFLPIVTFLDPRFRSIIDADPELLDITVQAVRAMCASSAVATKLDEPVPSAPSTNAALKPATTGKAGLSFLFGTKNLMKPAASPLDVELQRYAAVESLALDQCPRRWWVQQALKFPLLAAAARRLFSVPAALPPTSSRTLAARRGWLKAVVGNTEDGSDDLDALFTVHETLVAADQQIGAASTKTAP